MEDLYTEKVQELLYRSLEEAKSNNHYQVDICHLLKSFFSDNNSMLCNVFTKLGISINRVSSKVNEYIKSVRSDNSNNEPNSLLKEFPAGVGEYFLPALGAIFNILLFAIALLVLSYKFGMYFIGNIGVSSETLLKAFESVATLKLFISSLTAEQLIRINNWNFLVMTTMATICFLVILYLPTLFYKEKNPFKSFFFSFKSLFSKKFFKTLGLYLLIYFVNLAISILSAIFTGNIFMHFLVTLLNFYYITLACVGVFYYYFKNFVESNLGQNIDIEV